MIPFGSNSVTLSMLIDLLTSRWHGRSTQVKLYTGLIASIDLWPQEMFTFSEMLALVQSESSFGAFVFHRRPAGLQATSHLVRCHHGHFKVLSGSRLVHVGSCVRPGKSFSSEFTFGSFTQDSSHAQLITSWLILLTNLRGRLVFYIFEPVFRIYFTMVNKPFLGGKKAAGGDRSAAGMTKCGAGVNADLGNGSFWIKIRDGQRVDWCRWWATSQNGGCATPSTAVDEYVQVKFFIFRNFFYHFLRWWSNDLYTFVENLQVEIDQHRVMAVCQIVAWTPDVTSEIVPFWIKIRDAKHEDWCRCSHCRATSTTVREIPRSRYSHATTLQHLRARKLVRRTTIGALASRQGHPRNLFRWPWIFGLSSQKHHTWPYHASVLWYTEANFSFQMQQRKYPRPYLRNDTMDFHF